MTEVEVNVKKDDELCTAIFSVDEVLERYHNRSDCYESLFINASLFRTVSPSSSVRKKQKKK